MANEGQVEEALELLNSLKLAEPGNGLIPFRIGLIHEKNNDSAAAVIAYRKSVELDPTDPQSNVRLAYLLRARGEEEEGQSDE